MLLDRSPPSRPRLLLAEHDPLARRTLQMLLSGRGMEVRAYGSGRDVLNDPLTRQAHALVADYGMPDVDGLELMAALRARGWLGRGVLITGLPRQELTERALAAGFEGVLEKPVSEASLLMVVDRLLS